MGFDADTAAARLHPVPVASPVESILAGHIISRVLVVGPLIVIVAWLLSGPSAAWSAAIGVGIVVANFLLAGWLLSRAATVSLQAYHAVALFGFFIRMGFVALSMLAVAWLIDVDRRAMGLAVVTAFLALLVLEAVAIARGRRKDMEWS